MLLSLFRTSHRLYVINKIDQLTHTHLSTYFLHLFSTKKYLFSAESMHQACRKHAEDKPLDLSNNKILLRVNLK